MEGHMNINDNMCQKIRLRGSLSSYGRLHVAFGYSMCDCQYSIWAETSEEEITGRIYEYILDNKQGVFRWLWYEKDDWR